jgi:alpha-tubulin suppressor-like RCC1 family protein
MPGLGVRRLAASSLALVVTLVVTLAVAAAGSVAAPVAPRVAKASVGSVPGLTAVTAGGEFSCGLRPATGGSTLWCWGRNTEGQLGLGSRGSTTMAPTQVGTRSDWVSVDAGGSTACAVRADRKVFCWGLNHRGQVGSKPSDPVTSPKRVKGIKDVRSVSVGWFHSCAVRTDGRAWCWGENGFGQLGKGDTRRHGKPQQLKGRWTSVKTSAWNTCGIRSSGKLKCWGRNLFGQVGAGEGNVTRPVTVGPGITWAEVDLSWTHTCARTTQGAVYCWGRNDRGQVGSSAAIYVNRPYAVPGGHVARSVSVSEGTSCLVDTGGQVWCWGDNRFGQVDAAAGAETAQPSKRSGTFSAVSGGWWHVCGLQARSGAVCWGDDQRGQLGTAPVGKRGTDKAAVARPAAGRQGSVTFRLATFNTLSNGHTRPGADADQFGPSRMRADWTAQALDHNLIDVAGLQEQDAGQLSAILEGSAGRLAAYPDPRKSALVQTAIVWDKTKFTAVQSYTFRSQFIRRVLPRPAVRLRERTTGREFWVVTVHNAPNQYQKKRDQAIKAQIKEIKKLEDTGLPVFFVGDLNEKKTAFCKIVGKTGLVAPQGGRVKGDGTCQPPRQMRIDWLFGSATTVWSGFGFVRPPLVVLASDHMMVLSDVTLP